MIVQKNKSGQYEASCVINEGVILKDGRTMFVEYNGFGFTHIEAIKNCLIKIDQFLNPGDYQKCNDCGSTQCMCYEDAVGI